MVQYDASKNKARKWRCGARPVYFSPIGIIITTILISFLTVLLVYKLQNFLHEPEIDFRFGDVCAYLRHIDHPVEPPKEGSRLLVLVHVDTMEQLGNAFDQIMLLIDRLGKADLHVSLSINKGLDLAPPWMEMMQSLLKSKRIPFVHFYEGERLALQSHWNRSYDATHIITIRTSFFCADDVLRLYWQIEYSSSNSSLACGVPFARTTKRRLRLDFTDLTLRALGVTRDFSTRTGERPTLKRILTGYTTQVECCWSNVAALSGHLLLSKPESNGDCLGYDCGKICELADDVRLVPSVPVVHDQATRSLIAVAPLYPHIHSRSVPDL